MQQKSKIKISVYYFLFYIFCFLFFVVPVFSEFKAPTHLIDTPTAYSASTSFSVGVNLSLTTKEDSHPLDWNSYIGIAALNRVDLGISLLTSKIISFEFKFKINQETNYMPAIAMGSKYIATYEWICPIGTGKDIIWDDDQSYNDMRTSEQYSLFLVATKDIGPYGIYNIGIGNGCFVGYGPRSRLFNSDVFSKEYHSNAVGIFWGAEILLLPHVFGLFDFDGRDFNMGIKIRSYLLQLGISASKLEHRLKGSEAFYPRFAIGLNMNSFIFKKWSESSSGMLTVVVNDAKSGNPRRAVISFPGTSILSMQTNKRTGTTTVRLPCGTYWIRAGTLGYHWAEKKISVHPRMTTVCYFEIFSIIP